MTRALERRRLAGGRVRGLAVLPRQAAGLPAGAAPLSYRDLVRVLCEYEGRRCLWRVAAGGALLALAPVAAVGGLVAGAYLTGGLRAPLRAALAAVVTLAAGQIAKYLLDVRRWRVLFTARLATLERMDPPGDLNTMIRHEGFLSASRALRRRRLSPFGGTHVPAAVCGVPGLELRLIVYRSALRHPPGGPELHVQIRDCLRDAGIRANVAAGELLP